MYQDLRTGGFGTPGITWKELKDTFRRVLVATPLAALCAAKGRVVQLPSKPDDQGPTRRISLVNMLKKETERWGGGRVSFFCF